MDNERINEDEVIRYNNLKFDVNSSYEYLCKTKNKYLYIPYLYHFDKSMNNIDYTPSFQELTAMLIDGSAFSYDTVNECMDKNTIQELEPMFKKINELEVKRRTGENVDKGIELLRSDIYAKCVNGLSKTIF